MSVNVTERRQLEDQLRQAQKMEARRARWPAGSPTTSTTCSPRCSATCRWCGCRTATRTGRCWPRSEQAATRAADLTRKLLGYARRNQLVFAPVEPRDAFDEVVALLRRTLDPRVKLSRRRSHPDCPPVHADPTLLAQALMNLCLNARDAMPDGGTLTLSAEPVERDRRTTRARRGWDDVTPGRYVRLAVADTGTGMTDEVLARHVRAVLHHQGDRQGDRAGAADGPGDREAAPRVDRRSTRARGRARGSS